MPTRTNSRANLLTMFHDAQVKGPVLWGSTLVEKLKMQMDVAEFSVTNKTRLPELPFGILYAELRNERNSNHAWLRLHILPTYWEAEGTVVFPAVSEKLENPFEYIETATRTYQVVSSNAVDSGSSVWESTTEKLDDQHWLKVTTTVNSGIDQIDDDWVFDGTTNTLRKRRITLVNTSANPSESLGANYVKTFYRSLRPGWWLKVVDTHKTSNTQKVENFNEYIEVALVTYTIVALTATPDQGITVWESDISPIGDTYGVKRTVTVTTGIDQYDDQDSYDDELQKFFKRKITLVHTYAAPTFTGGNYIYCQSLRPGWWLKVQEEIGTAAVSYTTSGVTNYSLPPVLDDVEVRAWETIDGALRYFPHILWAKEAYSGPCKATILVEWQTGAFGDTVLGTQMKPASVYYSCPFFTISISPSLHAAGYLECNIGSGDAEWAENVDTRIDYDATTPTTWPSSFVADATVRPYKGGYLRKTLTIFPPA